MFRTEMRSRTRKFLSLAGAASIFLGLPGTLVALFNGNFTALVLPILFVFGGFLLIGLVVYEQVPKRQRRRKKGHEKKKTC